MTARFKHQRSRETCNTLRDQRCRKEGRETSLCSGPAGKSPTVSDHVGRAGVLGRRQSRRQS